ncbi:MAG: acyl-CoA dehydrogenase family protein [Acidimicrobiales bacterium]|nr:acyl-CoA dehydrogenase family protein [Acidimicrobiales bacterium]
MQHDAAPVELATPVPRSPAERAGEFATLIAAHVEETQRTRRPAQAVMRALADAGLLRVLAPRAYGGEEASGLAFMELVERIARVDGSAGWAAMTLNEEIEISAGYLPAETMRRVCTSSPAIIVAGSGAALGRARRVEGGWRLSGRWPFVTGGPAADEIVVGATVEGPKPRPLCFALLPAEAVTILDTWDTVGLRGTGSHDVTLDDAFVPDGRMGVVRDGRDTVPETALFRLPPSLRFPFPKVGVATGIARAAIAEFSDLAQGKKARVSRTLLRDRPDAQLAMARAEALVGAGWAFAAEMVQTVWALAEAGVPVPAETHARTRLACTHAVANCVEAVQVLCTAAGTTANFTSSPLHRHLADVRAVPQHVMVGAYNDLDAGRVLLGLDATDPLF